MLRPESGAARLRGGLAMLAVWAAVAAAPAAAVAIGQYAGSARSWNNPQMTTLRSTLIAAGHVVDADSAVSDAALAATRMFVIGEPQQDLPTGAIASLATYVRHGGVLLLLADVGANPTFYNDILAGLGSSITIAGSAVNAPLAAGVQASEGPPFGLVGRSLAVTSGSGVGGGSVLAGSYVRYEALGQGLVFVFGDRLDHNALVPTAATLNGQLFLNIAAASAPPPVAADTAINAIPALSGWGLCGLIALIALVGARRRRAAR